MKTFIQFVVACLLAQIISAQPNTWTRKANYGGVERKSAFGFSIGGKGYIGGGCYYDWENWYYYNDFWEFDPVSNVWTQKANSPDTTGHSFSIGNKGYLHRGGLENFWEFDPASNTWTKKANYPGIDGAIGFSIAGKGYLGTGSGTKEFWEYNPITDIWTKKADFGVENPANNFGFSIGSKGYLGSSWKQDLWEYNSIDDTWKQKAYFPAKARLGAVGFSIGSKGYLGLGYYSWSIGDAYLKDFWEYDPAADTWTQKAYFVGWERENAVGLSIGYKGYLGTGHFLCNEWECNNEYYYNDFWEYTPEICNGLYVYADTDNDGYGNKVYSLFVADCILPQGYVYDSTDCNDADATIYPGAYEIIGDGIDNNCNSFIDEDLNNALSFDGINDYVGREAVNLPTGSIMTVEAWIYPQSYYGGEIVSWGEYDDYCHRKILLSIQSNGRPSMSAFDCGNDFVPTTGPTAKLNAWNHIAVVLNGTSVTLYMNGVPISGTLGRTPNVYSENLAIGRLFNGKIDEVRIWNYTRTEAEIIANMNVRICKDANGLVAYYPLNQGNPRQNNTSVITANDVTANNNDGILYNFALTGITSNWVKGVPDLSDDSATFYRDADSDGYGNPGVSITAPACEPPTGYVWDNTDCNDANPSINPGAPEICGNRTDDNCNGTVDEGCMVITNVTNINSSQATIHWKAIPNASAFRLRSYPAGTTHYKYYGYETPVTDTFKTITNLFPVTQYNVQVMALFAGGTDSSDWSAPYSFTTQGYCNPPTGLQVGTVTSTSAKLLWSSPVSAVSHYELRIRRNGAPEWTVRPIQPATESITINGLRPGTQYQWQLRSGCINITDKSNWAKGPLFTTTGTAVTANSSASLTAANTTATLLVSPNPNKGQFTIQAQLPGKAVPTTITLYNNLGAKVWQYTAGSISGQWHSTVELENKLTPGMYTLMLQRSDIKLVQKVLISKQHP